MSALTQQSRLSRGRHASCHSLPRRSLPSAAQSTKPASSSSPAKHPSAAGHDTAGQVTNAPGLLARGGAHSKCGERKDWLAVLLVWESPQIGTSELDQATKNPVTDLFGGQALSHVTDRIKDTTRISDGSVTDIDTDQ